MKVLLEPTTAEIVEKKSRFIANVFYVNKQEDADEKLNEIRKKYYDAKHNCFAYIIGVKADNMKSSDDGEPSGTAGHPMLDILKGNNLTNCIAIVTRYFGGILLGTGGLVRAYSDSLKMALDSAKTSEIESGIYCDFEVNYDDYGKVEKLVCADTISIGKDFADNVKLSYLIKENYFEKFSTDIRNITKGKVTLIDKDRRIFYINNKKVIYI